MPKINQEEYEILKNLDDKWKWIARDENRGLYAFTKKPVRKDGPSSYWWDADGWDAEPYAALGLVDEIHLFQFIQWEDEEPYNIAELIREYEKHEFVKINHEGQERLNKLFGNESEEKEMKDIEWLRKEFDDLFNGKSILTVGKSVVDEIINQLDEPETLSQEWIEEHKESWKDLSVTGYSVPEKDLQNLLVPKQEEVKEGRVRLIVGFDGGTESYYATDIGDALDFLTDYDARFTVTKEPSIPQFVADWIEHNQEDDLSDTIHFIIYGLYADWPDTNSSVELRKPVLDWLEEDRNNYFKLVDATRYGYEIEQEPKYYVRLPLANGEVLELYESVGKMNFKDINVGITGAKVTFTEQEIKDYDPRFWDFAEPVEELEE